MPPLTPGDDYDHHQLPLTALKLHSQWLLPVGPHTFVDVGKSIVIWQDLHCAVRMLAKSSCDLPLNVISSPQLLDCDDIFPMKFCKLSCDIHQGLVIWNSPWVGQHQEPLVLLYFEHISLEIYLTPICFITHCTVNKIIYLL